MKNLSEAISRFRLLSEASIGKAMRAAEKLSSTRRFDTQPPHWLNGIGVRVDSMRNGYVEVGVIQGYPLPNFPSHVDGVPVVVTHRSQSRARVQ